jgi:hypothetical protein
VNIDTRELMNYRTPTRTANELKKSKARIRDLIRTNKLQAIETPLGFLVEPTSIERLRREMEQD